MEDKTKYWVEISDYDLETAEAMLSSRRFLYVGYMCHQCLEKMLKACYSKVKNDPPPYSHNLRYLAEKSDLFFSFSEEQKSFLNQIEPLNIEARYPSYKENLMKSLTEEKCKELLNKTREIQTWLKKKL